MLSVVIPTRNRRELLLRELDALARQTLPPGSFEVVVADDGSTDGTDRAVEASSAPFALHRVALTGRGRAAACNGGIRAANGDIIVLLDDDMVPVPGMLEAHAAAHRDGARIGVMGPVPIDTGESSTTVARYIGSKFNRHLARLAAGGAIGFHDVYTGNFSIRRSLLDEVGLFDEAFTVYGNEDGELAVRLLAAGVRFTYAAGAIARQSYTKSFADLARDNEAKGRTAVVLARKHPATFSGLRLSDHPTWRRRLARTVLLGMTRAWRGTPSVVAAAIERLGLVAPAVAMRAYPAALDYFFWLGANAEAGRRAATNVGTVSDTGRP